MLFGLVYYYDDYEAKQLDSIVTHLTHYRMDVYFSFADTRRY